MKARTPFSSFPLSFPVSLFAPLSLCLLWLLAFSGAAHAANDATAGSMQKFCEPFRTESGPSIDKAYCRGYMVGLRAGIDGAQIPDDKGVVQTVVFTDNATDAQMAKEFVLYMDNHPDEKDSLPKTAVMRSLLSSGLVKLTPSNNDAGKEKEKSK